MNQGRQEALIVLLVVVLLAALGFALFRQQQLREIDPMDPTDMQRGCDENHDAEHRQDRNAENQARWTRVQRAGVGRVHRLGDRGGVLCHARRGEQDCRRSSVRARAAGTHRTLSGGRRDPAAIDSVSCAWTPGWWAEAHNLAQGGSTPPRATMVVG